uniref:amino acid--tRNA ligase-related protein n=1 Tax=Persicitalea sp. TaxID=3100273 RepID=UPI003593C821
GAKGLIYVRYNEDRTLKSSVDKFYDEASLQQWSEAFDAQPGDLLLLISGEANQARKQLSELRLEMGNRLGLRKADDYRVLWVVDFPLLEYGEGEHDATQGRWYAMHHPFTSPKPEDIPLLATHPGKVRANAYDMVINGVEVGGGSVRIFQKELQKKMFEILGFTAEEAQAQFGFLLNAFEFGAPPHAGIAFGFDRLCSLFGGAESIRDFIAFPKNNSGRDVMIDSPSPIADQQLKELSIKVANN